MQHVAEAVELCHREVICVDVYAHGAELEVGLGPVVRPGGAGEDPPALGVAQEAIADGLASVQGREQLPVSMLESDVLEHEVLLTRLLDERVWQSQPKREGAVLGDRGRAALVARGLVL